MKRSAAMDLVLALCCVAAVGIAGLSYLRLRQLSVPAVAPVPPPTLGDIVGHPLRALHELLPSGEIGSVSSETLHRPTVLLFFKSTCLACEANATNWAKLAAQPGRRFDVIAVSSEGGAVAAEWFERHHISHDRVLLPQSNAELNSQWGIQAVPTTIVVDEDGLVSFGHVGILQSANLDELQRLLPGS
ncbi:MAG TPA: TlpA disulfide reductase family protein [Gemmatimonadales bacterium]|nr:TlpA disulfide reductase family protein [Gemmatimonadales bacterium]